MKNTNSWREKNWDVFLQKTKENYHERMKTDPKFREYRKEISKNYYRKHRAKILIKHAEIEKTIEQKARHELRYAIRRGLIKKPESCDACNQSGKIQGHHEDYSKPLNVIWLCKICHEKLHHKK